MLIVPASHRFLPVVRQAVNTLVAESSQAQDGSGQLRTNAGAVPMFVFELQLAVSEACNVFAHVYEGYEMSKTISVSARFDGDEAYIVIDDGAGSKAGGRVQRQVKQGELSFEGDLALKTAQGLCDAVNLSSGLTGGLRIELKKHFNQRTR